MRRDAPQPRKEQAIIATTMLDLHCIIPSNMAKLVAGLWVTPAKYATAVRTATGGSSKEVSILTKKDL